MKLFYCFLIVISFSLAANTQDSTSSKKIDYKLLDRIVFVGSNFKKSVFYYMDGPRVLFNADKKVGFKIGFAFFPTLYYNFKDKDLSTKLGAGLRVDYKKMSIGFPFYSVDDKWKLHFGVGFKF